MLVAARHGPRLGRAVVALGGYALGLVVTVQVLSQTGPGGDVLVPDGPGSVGVARVVWVLGSIAVLVVAALLPRGAGSTTAPGAAPDHARPVAAEHDARRTPRP